MARKEKQYQDLFEMSQDGILLRPLSEDTFLDCNQVLLDMLGYADEKEAFLRLGLRDIVFATQDDGQLVEADFCKSESENGDVAKNRFEGLLRRRDGTPLYADIAEFLTYIDGRPTIQSVVRDIHDDKEIEARLRQLSRAVEVSSAVIMITDYDGHITRVNEKFCQLTGYSFQDVERRNPRLLRSGEHDSDFYRDMWQTIKKGDDWHGVLRNKKKNGQSYWVRTTISSVLDEQGEVSHFVCVQDDITHIRQLEHQLEVARQGMEDANRAKSDFLARMSHEIRTPMNAILGMNHLALMTDLNPRQREYIEKAHGAARSLLGIINDILDFSKIEAGKLSVEKVSFDLDELFDQLGSVAVFSVSGKDISVLFDIPDEVPRALVGDPVRLQQVLSNLISNAIKFTEKGNVVVRVAVTERAKDEVWLLFEVVDDGIGMTEKQVTHAFQPFRQADGSFTRRYGGTGLGLAICRRLVALMNGKIAVDSTPGSGSRFYFTAKLGIGKKRKQTLSLPEWVHSQKILVVDADRTSRNILVRDIAALGLQVIAAENSREASDSLANTKFDLAFLDWNMEGLTDCMDELRAMSSHQSGVMRFILIAQKVDGTLDESARVLGAAGYLLKPFMRKTLIQLLSSALGKPKEGGGIAGREAAPDQELERGCVLLAEDNELNAEVAAELLRRVGVKMMHAWNGREAVEMAEKEDFDAILMDLQMPELDGLEATKLIREKNPDVPIIAMTASVMNEDRDACEKAGMDDYLAKPFEPATLYGLLARWIDIPLIEEGTIVRQMSLSPDDEDDHKNDNFSIPAIEGIATETALIRLEGNSQLYLQLLRRFCDRYRNMPSSLKKSVSEGAIEEAKRVIHTFKGLCGTLGAGDLQKEAEKVERLLLKNDESSYFTIHEEFSEKVMHQVACIEKNLSEETVPEVMTGERTNVLRTLLLELGKGVERRQPLVCNAILQEMETCGLPAVMVDKCENLADLLIRYRYRDAEPLLRDLLKICDEKIEDGCNAITEKSYPDRGRYPGKYRHTGGVTAGV